MIEMKMIRSTTQRAIKFRQEIEKMGSKIFIEV